MIKKYDIIELKQSKGKNTDIITKFGGQPVWLNDNQWPISSGWKDRKMMFLGQIVLGKDMLGNEKDLVVYIFLTHPNSYDDNFFDPDVMDWDSGENTVIIQTYDEEKDALKFFEGPVLFNKDNERYEYIPVLKESYDPEYITKEEYRKLDTEKQGTYFDSINTNKIGGTPNFYQEDAWPGDEWILLLQLKCETLPFVLRLGDMPILFVLISKDFKRAGLFVQD